MLSTSMATRSPWLRERGTVIGTLSKSSPAPIRPSRSLRAYVCGLVGSQYPTPRRRRCSFSAASSKMAQQRSQRSYLRPSGQHSLGSDGPTPHDPSECLEAARSSSGVRTRNVVRGSRGLASGDPATVYGLTTLSADWLPENRRRSRKIPNDCGRRRVPLVDAFRMSRLRGLPHRFQVCDQ